jgi:large subunit ribosomal protein L16
VLEPKKTKYRKHHRGRRKGKATSGNSIAFGEYGLVTLEAAWITARQIEASRVAIAHKMKKGGKLWMRIFPDKPVTKKPAETRMGKGKGAPEYWVSVVKPGRIIFELEGMNEGDARILLRLAANKLPIKTRFVKREPGVKYESF